VLLTTDEGKVDAVVVEAGARGQTEALAIAQKYRVAKRSGNPVRIGKAMILGPVNQLLT
jgi:hypothetical protein